MKKSTYRSQKFNTALFGWLFVLPFLLVFFIFNVYPIVYSLFLSFTRFSGYTSPEFVGLKNFFRLFREDPIFPLSVFNTWYIWLGCFIFQLTMALVLSGIFSYSRVKGITMWRSFYYFPNLVSSAVMAVIFINLFRTETGSVNLILEGFGMDKVNWLGNEWIARSLISFVIWLQWYGVFIIYFAASISAIPLSLFEAAKIDGCPAFKAYRVITLPLLRPIIFYIMVISLTGGMQIFEQPYLISDRSGAPSNALTSMVMYLYRLAFTQNQMGYGSAVGVIIFLMIMVGTFFLNKVNNHYKKKYI